MIALRTELTNGPTNRVIENDARTRVRFDAASATRRVGVSMRDDGELGVVIRTLSPITGQWQDEESIYLAAPRAAAPRTITQENEHAGEG